MAAATLEVSNHRVALPQFPQVANAVVGSTNVALGPATSIALPTESGSFPSFKFPEQWATASSAMPPAVSAFAVTPEPMQGHHVPLGQPSAPFVPSMCSPGLPSRGHVPPGTEAIIAGQRVIMPNEPMSNLTAGLAKPEDIERQKDEYKRHVQEELRQGEAMLTQQAQRKKDHARMQAEQQKAIENERCDQLFRTQEMALEQEHQQRLAALHEVVRKQKLVLHQQAAELNVEYQSRKAQEDLSQRQYEIKLQRWEAEQRVGLEMSRQWPSQMVNSFQAAQPQSASLQIPQVSSLQSPMTTFQVPPTSVALPPQAFNATQGYTSVYR